MAAAQQKLSQEKLKQLFESMNSGVAVYNAVKGGDNFVFAGINRSAEKIEKVKRKDVVGKKVTDVFPGIKKFGLFRVLKRVWETGKSEKYTMKFYVDERRSGWRDNYVYKLPSGEVVAIYQDTTAIVETNKMVADLAKFPKENPSPVYRISGQGELIYSNDAGKKLLECKVCSIGGKGLIDGLKGKVKKTLLSRKIVVCEVECNKKIYSFNLAPIMSGGYVNVYGTDITDRIKGEEALKEAKLQLIQLNEGLESRVRQQVEELRQSNERVIASEKLATIGRLAAGIAHELNSPLSGILALLWTRSKGGGVVEGEETKMILSACENMAKIIRDLNLFARTSVLEKTELDLVGLLEGVVNLSLSRARVNSAEIERKYFGQAVSFIGDSVRLQQVFLNLLNNAIDAVRGGGLVSIDVDTSKKHPGFVKIEVADNGCGMTDKVKAHMFDPFYTTKAVGEGVGLGLSTVHTIVEEHGGNIEIESSTGKGTTVRILLPLSSAT